jgi:hypothetical protein
MLRRMGRAARLKQTAVKKVSSRRAERYGSYDDATKVMIALFAVAAIGASPTVGSALLFCTSIRTTNEIARGGLPEPGEALRSLCARDRSLTAETRRGSVHEGPVRWQPHAQREVATA